MRKITFTLFALFIISYVNAQMVGIVGEGRNAREMVMRPGATNMSPQKNIIENAASSGDFSTLLMLLQSAGLVETLSSPGPYTLFAPANKSFSKISPANLASLSDNEHKSQLTKILGLHAVAGRFDQNSLQKMIKDNDGTATLTTLAGLPLTVTKKGKKLVISDGKNLKATIQTADVEQSNGIIHVIDNVLMEQ